MTVGVKFCGGCNPVFDRGGEYQKLKERHPHIAFETYDPSKKYEKLILISGCARTCLRDRKDFKAENIIIAGSAKDMEAIKL